MAFGISESAREHLSQVLSGEKPFFRISVDAGGCFGFQYLFSLEKTPNSQDEVYTFKNVSILVDDVTLPFVQDAELDFVSEMMGGRFVIHNPQADSSCGCKNSFSLKDA